MLADPHLWLAQSHRASVLSVSRFRVIFAIIAGDNGCPQDMDAAQDYTQIVETFDG
jgi:hypothetical protein